MGLDPSQPPSIKVHATLQCSASAVQSEQNPLETSSKDRSAGEWDLKI